ncbi:MAG TPA: extracellular solute-binding protein [Candidatus Limnocylindrales bacterium]|nr:extracellular solute-binding protein [Candidatus Limnocylindrales bacterium]
MAKFPRLITLSVVTMLVLSACGGGATPTPGGSGTPSTPPATGGSTEPGGSVTAGGSLNVLSLWGGSEEAAFKAMLAAFTTKTGITVNYEADRQTYSTTLQARITGGNPPDIAIIPGIGFLRRFVKDGALKKVADMGIDPATLTQSYPEGFLGAGTVDGTLYALPAKYNNKGTMWFRPDVFKTAAVTAPKTWDEFKAALTTLNGKPGAMALGAKDDWNLTDWFESIYIRQAGVDAYDKLFSKEGDWSDPTVQKTVDTMLEVINDTYVVGGIDKAVGRAWTDAIAQVFKPTPEAGVFYEGGFVGGIAIGQTNKELKPGETIDWFPFPSFGGPDVTTFGGDVIGALTDTAQAKTFLQYMITPEANTVWASTGAIVSPNKGVGTDKYPNDLVIREAKSLVDATAIRYDGSDLLPAGIQGENMGPLLQRAIKGEKIDWADFQARVKAAWDAE